MRVFVLVFVLVFVFVLVLAALLTISNKRRWWKTHVGDELYCVELLVADGGGRADNTAPQYNTATVAVVDDQEYAKLRIVAAPNAILSNHGRTTSKQDTQTSNQRPSFLLATKQRLDERWMDGNSVREWGEMDGWMDGNDEGRRRRKATKQKRMEDVSLKSRRLPD
jgi:hypothetical protein